MELKNAVIGLELGSTRIKAVLLDEKQQPVVSGSFEWENRLEDGIWTYDLEVVHTGVQACFADLSRKFEALFGQKLTTVGAMGISGMMHGYLPFDKDGRQLAKFRSWRNNIPEESAAVLSKSFGFHMPRRWSVSHLYQATLDGDGYLPQVDFLTTLCGYVHWRLTGRRVLGIGEAAGMFPIDSVAMDYDESMVQKYDALTAFRGLPWKLRDVLPVVLVAGEDAGTLTEEGAAFLDPTGTFCAGVSFVPPESDACTGMVATNSICPGTGSVSGGTSVFAMVVAEHAIEMHKEIDMVTTPTGYPAAMIHCDNFTSDINAWVNVFHQFASALGVNCEREELYPLLFKQALLGRADCDGLINVNYYSGEHITGLEAGRPLFVRSPNSEFTLPNFMRAQIFSALATLKIGMDILVLDEGVALNKIYAHGGFFKTPDVGQRMLSAAMEIPVSVMKTAGEGGPYGMALLAAYGLFKNAGETLEDYLDHRVFSTAEQKTVMAEEEDREGFAAFLGRYKKALSIEQEALSVI